MANEEHLAILMQGVEIWNQWRQENPEVKPDLSSANLSYADLTGVIFTGVTLSNADLTGADLIGADLDGANLIGASLSYADLNYANLKNANLSNADFADASLSNANLSSANLSDAYLSEAEIINADLSYANLQRANLSYTKFETTDLSRTNLNEANLSGANLSSAHLNDADLSSANLSRTNLSNAELIDTNLSYANAHEANLSHTNFTYALLLEAKLSKADLSYSYLTCAELNKADLSSANLEAAVLCGASLLGTNLSSANLSNADLNGSDLSRCQALSTSFHKARLTGTCIQDWNINSQTDLQGVICEYTYLRFDDDKQEFLDRLPHNPTKLFAPGDFAKLVQQSLNTVALIFREGLDWRSFAYSFQQLQVQYVDEQIAIQTIENKGDGTVVVKLAVAPDADKGNIEQSFWRGFEMAQKTIAEQYISRLEDKDKHINQLFTLLQQSQERLGEVPRLMAENPKYDLRGAKFGGGFAADGGTQTGGTFNDFSQNIEQNINEIGGLIQALHSQAETFPEGVRQETLDHIADLETDIGQPPEKRKPSRIKATLLALAGMATLVSGMVAGANEFATNVQELSEKLGIPLPIEQVQPQAQQLDAIDVKAIKTDQP